MSIGSCNNVRVNYNSIHDNDVVGDVKLSEDVSLKVALNGKMVVVLNDGNTKQKFAIKNGNELGSLAKKVNDPVSKLLLDHALHDFDKCHNASLEILFAQDTLRIQSEGLQGTSKGFLGKIKNFFRNHFQSLNGKHNDSEIANFKYKQESALDKLRITLNQGAMNHKLCL